MMEENYEPAAMELEKLFEEKEPSLFSNEGFVRGRIELPRKEPSGKSQDDFMMLPEKSRVKLLELHEKSQDRVLTELTDNKRVKFKEFEERSRDVNAELLKTSQKRAAELPERKRAGKFEPHGRSQGMHTGFDSRIGSRGTELPFESRKEPYYDSGELFAPEQSPDFSAVAGAKAKWICRSTEATQAKAGDTRSNYEDMWENIGFERDQTSGYESNRSWDLKSKSPSSLDIRQKGWSCQFDSPTENQREKHSMRLHLHSTPRTENSNRHRETSSHSDPYFRFQDDCIGNIYPGRVGECGNFRNDSRQALARTSDGVQQKKPLLTPQTYDGTTSIMDYQQHFETCVEINHWNEKEKALFLAGSLKGRVQQVLSVLSHIDRRNYEKLLNALHNRFLPPNQTQLYGAERRARRRRRDESLPELGQSIRRKVGLAYPTATLELQDVLARDAFCDALQPDSDMVWKIQQSRPANLEAAIHIAVELEAFRNADTSQEEKNYQRSLVMDHDREFDKITKQLELLTRIVETVQSERLDASTSQNRGSQISKQGTFAEVKAKRVKTETDNQGKTTDWKKQNVKCYRCSKMGHYAKECTVKKKDSMNAVSTKKRRKKNYGRRRYRRNRTGTIDRPNESGLYVQAVINSQSAFCLIDTGATVSVVSHRLYDSLGEEQKPLLTKTRRELTAANGEHLRSYGKATFAFHLEDESYMHEAVVADIASPCILGLDFLRKHDCKIDVNKSTLSLAGQTCPTVLEGSIGVCRITLSETVSVPPRREVMVSGRVQTNCEEQLPSSCWMVEPTETMMTRHHVMAAKALVKPAGSAAGIPVRLLNPSNEAQIIYKNTTIGSINPVELVSQVCAQEKRQGDCSLPEHLQEILSDASQELTATQAGAFKDLLVKRENVFAKSPSDMGCTDGVQHQIKTGDASPIKHRPRRWYSRSRSERELDGRRRERRYRFEQRRYSTDKGYRERREDRSVGVKRSFNTGKVRSTAKKLMPALHSDVLDTRADSAKQRRETPVQSLNTSEVQVLPEKSEESVTDTARRGYNIHTESTQLKVCQRCHFSTSKTSNWKRHLETSKHVKTTNKARPKTPTAGKPSGKNLIRMIRHSPSPSAASSLSLGDEPSLEVDLSADEEKAAEAASSLLALAEESSSEAEIWGSMKRYQLEYSAVLFQ